MLKKVVGQLFPRSKYTGTAAGRFYFPQNRSELQKVLGGASTVYLHVRVYDRSTGGTPALDFEATAGCFGSENPSEGLAAFSVSASGATPTLPWNTTNMATVPADGTFSLTPTMGHLDIAAKVTAASAWVEFEAWYTAVYAG